MLMAFLPFLSACSTQLNVYKAETPELDLKRFFNGQLEAYGIVQDFRGKVTRRFRVDILGQWQGNQGFLDELFYFDDGEEQHRCWQLVKSGTHYRGTAGDVIGNAEGSTAGNALNWGYVLAVPIGGQVWNIRFDDWMYLVDENNLINRARMYKFGFEVGQITLYLRKVSDEAHRAPTPECGLAAERRHVN